ncbi:hypothetical protein DQM11_09030 [Leuconostoc pseudomesenteroides]|uniref:ImmA/IrrE family metallo-endopeptidase n=1 Tax=Leuconostoc mesenteroides TaxID=1245 RepID=UPI000E09CAE0|nr:ImmA/IrrE family metallo-endopeptidase [Leuconostoc mesenteroides]RDG17661.1 hypothetical protein DQM11_09030 [Leuconostoc pseudomesenteroides]
MEYEKLYNENLLEKINKSKLNALEGLDTDSTEERIDIEEIAEKLGLTIVKENMAGESGKLEGNVIHIDSSESVARQRFTIGHEIGHYLLGQDDASRHDEGEGYTPSQRKQERLANAYAAQLLMPVNLVVNTIKNIIDHLSLKATEISEKDFDKIVSESANRLQVSEPAFRYRVKNLQVFSE